MWYSPHKREEVVALPFYWTAQVSRFLEKGPSSNEEGFSASRVSQQNVTSSNKESLRTVYPATVPEVACARPFGRNSSWPQAYAHPNARQFKYFPDPQNRRRLPTETLNLKDGLLIGDWSGSHLKDPEPRSLSSPISGTW